MADENAGAPNQELNPEQDPDLLMDEDDDSFEEVDMIEILDDDDDDWVNNESTDQGDLGDVEDEGDGEEDSDGPGLDGFTGVKPDYILTAHMGHAVFCTAFDSAGLKLITGGEDDVANVWDSSSIKTRFPILKCKGHVDSVVSASFSFDSAYFCTCDLSGLVKVWKTSSNELITSFETGDLAWSFWHFGSNVLFAGCEDGSIYMWKIPSGDCKIYSGSTFKCECATLLPDGKRIVAGYADGAVKMFDLKSGEVIQVLAKANPQDEVNSVLSIDHAKNHSIVATGSQDGTVKLYNTQSGKLITVWQCTPGGVASSEAIDDDKQHCVETVAFCPDPLLDYLAAGSVTGHITVWDVTLMTERLRLSQEVGLTKIIWDPTSPVFYTGGLDGVIRVIDARSCKLERLLGRHRAEVLDLTITKDGHKLASGSEDGSAFIFNLKQA